RRGAVLRPVRTAARLRGSHAAGAVPRAAHRDPEPCRGACRMNRFALVCLLSAAFAAAAAAQRVDRDGPKVSPLRALRSVDGGLEVQVDDDTWFALESVAGVETATLLREADRLCGDKAWKRITEDLPALLAAMGTEVVDRVDLVLRDLETGD